jgi:hypothetical protein
MPISITGLMIPNTLQAPDLPANVLEFDDDALLDIVQRQTARYFWEGAHPVSDLARDRRRPPVLQPTISWRSVVLVSASWPSSLRLNADGSIVRRR